MLLGELEGEEHVSPSWTGEIFNHYQVQHVTPCFEKACINVFQML